MRLLIVFAILLFVSCTNIVPENCNHEKGIYVCVAEKPDGRIEFNFNVTRKVAIHEDVCSPYFTIEKKEDNEWTNVDVWGRYGKNCYYFIGDKLTDEEMNSYCRCDYGPQITYLSPRYIQKSWDKDIFSGDERVEVDSGQYRVVYYGISREFKI